MFCDAATGIHRNLLKAMYTKMRWLRFEAKPSKLQRIQVLKIWHHNFIRVLEFNSFSHFFIL